MQRAYGSTVGTALRVVAWMNSLVTYEYFFCSSALDKKLFPKTLNQVTFEENINSNLFLFIQLSGICLLLVSIFQIEFLNALLDELRVCICSIFEDTSTRKVDLAVEGTWMSKMIIHGVELALYQYNVYCTFVTSLRINRIKLNWLFIVNKQNRSEMKTKSWIINDM